MVPISSSFPFSISGGWQSAVGGVAPPGGSYSQLHVDYMLTELGRPNKCTFIYITIKVNEL